MIINGQSVYVPEPMNSFRIRHTLRIFRIVASHTWRKFGGSFVLMSISKGGLFLVSAAGRAGLFDGSDDWIQRSPTAIIVWGAFCGVGVGMAAVSVWRDWRAGRLTSGPLALATFVVLPPVLIGNSVGFGFGCALVTSYVAGLGTAAFVALPLRIAAFAAGLREGDVVDLTVGTDPRWYVVQTRPDLLLARANGDAESIPGEETFVLCTMHVARRPELRLGRSDTIALVEATLLAHRKLGQATLRNLEATVHWLHRPARVIQRAWRRCAADPSFAVCRKRLMREAGELCTVRDG